MSGRWSTVHGQGSTDVQDGPGAHRFARRSASEDDSPGTIARRSCADSQSRRLEGGALAGLKSFCRRPREIGHGR